MQLIDDVEDHYLAIHASNPPAIGFSSMKTKQPLCIFYWITGYSLLASLGLLVSTAKTAAEEKLPEGLKVLSVEAYPAQIELTHRFDNRQLLITGHLETGEIIDLTRLATLAQPPTTVTLTDRRLVRPISDGEEQLVFQFEEHSVNIPVKVTGANQARSVSFVQDVQPAFSKMSCNAGTCHGSKDGKNGFKLSLRGYDPLYDHRAFTDDIGARRINRAAPDQSLMLLKATGSIPHVGGVRTRVGEPYYELVRAWVAAGSKLDLDAPRVTSIEILPQNPIVPRAGMKQQMTVMASYADGSIRDVTNSAFIESGNIEVIEADEQGLLTMLRRGEGPVLVRYEGSYAATTITVMGDRSGFVWNEPPTQNYIDELVYDKLQRVKILPSELCNDEDFVRRLFLDLTGLPPTSEELRNFIQDNRDSRTKREALIDQLVGGREYIEYWTNKWADMLQVNNKFLGDEGAMALRNWIKGSISINKPYDHFARDILTASGSTIENPPASYYKIMRNPADLMENTTHLFLAVRFNCNKCHDHPFERWTQDQYYHLAAYFAQIGLKEDPTFRGQKIGGTAVEGAKPLVEVVFDRDAGEMTHDRTGQTAAPTFPYEHDDVSPAAQSRRAQLAQWITSPKNQYFARSYVNRLWGYLFGTGIIEPIDDIRAGNPPTNPQLLDQLAKDFIESGFDVQHMLRTICRSRTYQHSIVVNEWNEDDELNYSHAIPRRLPAEVLYDAIHIAAGTKQKIPGLPPGFRAAEIPYAGIKVPFLDDFGKPVRESSCECERSSSMVLGPIMKLVNGPTVAEALADPQSELAQLVAAEPEDRKIIEEVFMRFFSRMPTENEIGIGIEAINTAASEHAEIVTKLEAYKKDLPAKQAAWEKTVTRKPVWSPLDMVEFQSQKGAAFTKKEDGSVLVSGDTGTGKEAVDVYTVTAQTEIHGITGLQIEVLPDPSLPASGPGRAPNGNLVLSELTVSAAPTADPSQAKPVKLQNGTASHSQGGYTPDGVVDNNPGTGWAIHPHTNRAHVASFETSEDISFEGSTTLTLSMSQQLPQHQIGRFRFFLTTATRPFQTKKLPEPIEQALAVAAEERSPEQQKVLSDHYRSLDKELQRLEQLAAEAELQLRNKRLTGIQDLAWALINNPAFLFNR